MAALALPAAAGAANRFVYVSEGFPAGNQEVSALRINPDGSLTAITGSPYATGGTTTEGLAITPNAQHLYVATFSTGDLRGWNIAADGTLTSVGASFPTGSTPLGVAPSPDGSLLFDWNHGNSIGVWTIAANGTLSQITGSPFTVASGYTNPFAGSVAPDGSHVYVPHENTSPGGGAPDTVGVYSVASNGALSNVQNATAGGPAGADGNPFGSGITPDGRFVYVSAPEDNASVGNVYGYAVGPSGLLSATSGSPYAVTPGGSHPLNIAIAPDGKHLYVATRATSVVKGYTINSDGSLTAIGAFATGGTNGKALALTPDGKRLYVSNNMSNNISGFDVLPDGSLSLIDGSPWSTGSTGNPDLESIAITPNQPPTAAFTMNTGFAGRPTGFDATGSTDSDGTVKTYDWDFGDGTTLPNGGPIPNHIYDHPGTFLALLTVTDNEGCSSTRIFTGKATLCNGSPVATATQLVTVKRDAIPPRFLRASVNPSQFSGSTTFKYSLSEAAKVVFTIQRKAKGRRVNGKCVPETAANRSHPRCTRYKSIGSFKQAGDAGPNAKRFSGKIGKKRLAAGSYRVKLVATDSAGNHSAPRYLNIRVVGAGASAGR